MGVFFISLRWLQSLYKLINLHHQVYIGYKHREMLMIAYSSSVSMRWARTISCDCDQAKTVKRPSCEATSAKASR